jgi:hypothetical protein
MKNQNAKKIHLDLSQQYGPYFIIKEIEIKNKTSIERKWEVIHQVTQKKYIMRPSYLNSLKIKYDGKLTSGVYQLGLRNYLYKDTIRGAKNRNHDFILSFEEFETLINGDCFYCGEPPKRATNKILITRGHINEPPLYYNGIDRLNPNDSYTKTNCVSCCSICNYMKHTQQVDEFLSHICKINNFINK